MGGGDNYLTTELRRGRDNGAIRFFYACVYNWYIRMGYISTKLSIQVSKLKFTLE